MRLTRQRFQYLQVSWVILYVTMMATQSQVNLQKKVSKKSQYLFISLIFSIILTFVMIYVLTSSISVCQTLSALMLTCWSIKALRRMLMFLVLWHLVSTWIHAFLRVYLMKKDVLQILLALIKIRKRLMTVISMTYLRKLPLMVSLVINGLLSAQATHWACSVYSLVSVRKRPC